MTFTFAPCLFRGGLDKAIIGLLTCFLILISLSPADAQRAVDDSKGLIAHDPVMIKQDSIYYLFMTHGGVAKSRDLETWTRIERISTAFDWVNDDIVPGYRRGYWAPDIQFFDGLYFLYYSVSAFGKNTSAIGVMTNKTLDQTSPDYVWEDKGMVVQSVPGRDFWNAIDANVIYEKGENGETIGWLSFGSFWGGLKLVKLAPDMISLAEPQEWYGIAQRERTFGRPDSNAGNGAIEAPFIYQNNGYYYLFASIDSCCKGLESTYKTIVGRSKDIRGPYLDQEGKAMYAGGGTILAAETEDYAGIGHCAVYDFDGKTIFVAHGYDKHDEGKSKLVIKEIIWDENDWPVIAV
ncbi:arabinan endo-1,5-alpha-L-arabinosidase [Algoriphagus locisalis]|uniref:Arabinan endo-1,5-alpha-L-arabinosidase n=1 Tax=Algoriphagus locisalis TaxID=305507 RepID=A0A1I6YXN9_9BACT|nr:family 43 glycosylhydrolase [Algoriphagus locisalis]SFT55246.1 arabinan endo-1,5-alpha-L-arabinosidase [Algoriphagus locisalis]